METAEKPLIEVYTESNPNPGSLKFVVNMDLYFGGNMDFPDVFSAKECPIAQDLFKFNFVKRVFIASNFITITKADEVEWFEISPMIKSFIKGYLEEGKPVFVSKPVSGSDVTEYDSEIVIKIKTILEEYVRPAVESDGGAITFRSFQDGIVTVNLQGSCSGCPSSTITLKNGIENLMTKMIPEVKSVIAEGI